MNVGNIGFGKNIDILYQYIRTKMSIKNLDISRGKYRFRYCITNNNRLIISIIHIYLYTMQFI